MAIYGTPITMGGGGGSNDTLPPLLDNFKATRLEAGLVPPTANTLAFKDIPDGSKIKLVKGSNISGTVTYGKTTDLNHRIVFDSNDWTKKEFCLENDDIQMGISDSDIDRWLNSTKASGWWTSGMENRNPPDYANEQGFLYQLGINDELLMQNFNDININATAKAKVGLPWASSHSEEIPYTFFENISTSDFGGYGFLYGVSGELVGKYDKTQTYAPSDVSINGWFGKIHPMMEPKPETKVALDVDGSYFMFEEVQKVTLSADKMPVSRANALAGAVWVYGEHEPKNVNDGTKVNLTREEIVLPEEGDTDIPPISYTELERPTSNKTWTAPEDGYYKFVGVAMGGYSGTARRIAGASYNVSGGSGGSGGIVASVFKLKRGESVSLTVTGGDVTISYGSETANATHGQDGGSSSSEPDNKVKLGSPGRAGTATGGNLINMNGKYGDLGERLEGNKTTIVRGGETVYEKHISRGGDARTTIQEGDSRPPEKGTTAYIAVLKGDSSSNKPLNFTAKASKTIADLPSKSKVKLGRYGDADLQWLVSRNAENKLFLILAAESMSVLETKMFDNAEPSNPNGDRASNGNNKYSLSNIHQWLNSDKSANSWYTKSHTYDASPDYTNLDGFLAKWTNAELQAVLNTTWTTTTAEVDGDNTETFQSKITLPSTTEMNLESNTGGSKLDIFDSNEDRTIAGKYYWCRTPFPSKPSGERMVDIKGKLSAILVNQTTVGVRPICSIPETTLVSDTPDSDGCYTLIAPPLERTVAWDKSKNFYARQFTYNSKKQYQTMLEGATAELLLGEVPLPVSNLAISENAGASPTLSWKNPTDKNYHETVVVQKEGSTPPRSTDDGIEVYRGNGESVTVKDLQSTVDYSFGVFTLSQYGNYGEPVTISYRYDFPSEPTSYTKLSEISESTTWKLPENGYFLICAVGKSGDGGKGVSIDATGNATGVTSCSIAGGGSGGTGSFSERLISGHKGDEYILTITNAQTKVERLGETIIHARAGGNGSDARADSRRNVYQGTGGAPGTSLQVDGSQIQNGESGQAGEKWQYDSSDPDNPWRVQGGRSVTRTYNSSVAIDESCSTSSGQGGDGNPIYQDGTYYTPGGTGTHGQIIIYRGNTNIPSPQ